MNLATDGVNLTQLSMFDDLIDIHRIYTNDISATLKVYGVEAARNAAMEEIKQVFGVYGITVDARHLSLIADYMVSDCARHVSLTACD